MAKKKTRTIAKKLFRHSLTDGHIDPVKVGEVTKLLKGMTEGTKLELYKNYARLIEIKINQETAFVDTPFEATGKWAEGIEKMIKDRFPEVSYVHFSIDPDLIAGIKVQIADMVYENSLKARLNLLRKVH
jgi:F-type H+-transporting ATPase subunit delta